jgi:hypothetical protein
VSGKIFTLLIAFLIASGLRAQEILPASSNSFVAVRPAATVESGFQWQAALADASLFLAVEHGFRLAEDHLVREKLGGPFLADYADSVRSIHGWGDGDPFLVNYVGHPTMGAVAGFIQIGHDPRYRSVEIGEPHYWKSRMRAMGFSAAYSLQFEIGPVSEASLGNSQLHSRNTGIVDWVITPTVGTLWIVAEDITDKYLVQKVERHTNNIAVLALARTFLNPCRGFSNLMGRRVPWHRDDRTGPRETPLELP